VEQSVKTNYCLQSHTRSVLEHCWSDRCDIATCWQGQWNEYHFKRFFLPKFLGRSTDRKRSKPGH